MELNELIKVLHEEGYGVDLSMLQINTAPGYKFWAKLNSNKIRKVNGRDVQYVVFHGEGDTILSSLEDAYKKAKLALEVVW